MLERSGAQCMHHAYNTPATNRRRTSAEWDGWREGVGDGTGAVILSFFESSFAPLMYSNRRAKPRVTATVK